MWSRLLLELQSFALIGTGLLTALAARLSLGLPPKYLMGGGGNNHLANRSAVSSPVTKQECVKYDY